MAPTIKNSKPNGLIVPSNWSSRVPDTTDAIADFYSRYNSSFHGYVYSLGFYNDKGGTKTAIAGGNYNTATPPDIILPLGPYTELTLQKYGTAGTVTIKGGLVKDGNNLVAVNLVTSADGLIRIQSLYKFIAISATGLDATSQLYLQIW